MKTRPIVGGVAAVALLAGLPAAPAFADDEPPKPEVSVHKADGVNGVQIADAIAGIEEDNRGDFTQKVVDVADDNDGGDYNVVIMNLSQGYDERLSGTRFYANVRYDSVNYGVWIAEGGEFENTGDGGYINWAFQGQFDRDGNTVKFH